MKRPLIFLFLYFASYSALTAQPQTVQKTGNFIVIWKYTIHPEHRATFEKEYGSGGKWVDLFKKSPSYIGSFLHQSNENKNIYLLIDTWKTRQSYEEFKAAQEQTYNQLSESFEKLYIKEEKEGEYNAL